MLEVNQIDAYYGEFQVLEQVSLQVGAGELRILLGRTVMVKARYSKRSAA